jgi:hypothetical protein
MDIQQQRSPPHKDRPTPLQGPTTMNAITPTIAAQAEPRTYQYPVIGIRTVKGKFDCLPYEQAPRKLNRELLRVHGYGEHVIGKLENGWCITYSDRKILPSGESILELTDGSRFHLKTEHLGKDVYTIEIVAKLPNGPR